ncbi:fumarylacetoacetate hydrolase family protein [Nostocoides sp. HKS02]|uniref:fumarylacetoacetate hydrolase family protein n=1 Tax=Nostocoides sp. HKS02 TaxID=1813880 RepID=UPI0012B44B41|nr:fumarylacetoacetate hydrolase family protein [Tetrasphaera sp. HKS02]QGN57398.1 2-hydroxyhepta-2,4-diene-1,7-dioate isomerase [Tetrasphaera sp. HKS02]
MRLATVATPDGATYAAVRCGDAWRALPAPDLSTLLTRDAWRDLAADPGAELSGATPVNPLPRPGKVICAGLNYAEHITEMGRDLPSHPTLFAKFADTLTGPHDAIHAPAAVELDWEAELAVVVGTELRGATEDDARRSIAGYTIANDISVRDWQRRTLQWLQGKAWDATTPIGPVVVTPDELDPEAGVEVTCEVNGATVQRGNTRTLVFGAATLLAYISQFTTLRAGDLVLTGTPGGVGMGMEPPRFLADGDVVRTAIAGIGALENTIHLT